MTQTTEGTGNGSTVVYKPRIVNGVVEIVNLSPAVLELIRRGGEGTLNIIDDSTPQLGGNLDINNNNIIGSGDIDIDGNISANGTCTFSGTVDFSGSTINNFPDSVVQNSLNSLSINDLSDVDTTSILPTDGQVLTWDNANNLWKPSDSSISGNITASTGNFDVINLSTTADPEIIQGSLGWNAAEGSFDVGLEDQVTINVGEHNFFRIRNSTVNTMYAGQAVYASGIHNNILIDSDLYTADGLIEEIRFMGLVLADIETNQKGYAINFGKIENIDTRGNGPVNGAGNLWDENEPAWSEGDILYISPTSAGKLTKIKPKHSVSVAIVLYVHQNNGRIFSRPTEYGHITDNHDVNNSMSPSNGQVLTWDNANGYWSSNDKNLFDNPVKEKFTTITNTTGTVDHDCSLGSIFYHTSITSDFIVNLTNLDLDENYSTKIKLILSQGITAFVPTGLEIEGVGQTIKLKDGNVFVGTSGQVDEVHYNIIRTSSSYIITGEILSFS